MIWIATKAYDIAFRLGAQLASQFSATFQKAEKIANQTSDRINDTNKKAAEKAQKIAEQSAAKAQNLADKTFNRIKKTVVAVGALVIGAASLGNAFETYQGFEQSMANTAATAGILKNSQAYTKLEIAALDAGKATSKTAQEAADALGYMALAGWSVEDSTKSLMGVLRLSEATHMDLGVASDMVTDTMSALGIAVDGVSLNVNGLDGYLDVVAKTQNSSNTSAQQLMEAYLAVGGTMKNLKVPMEESAAVLGLMANRGTKGAEAGNSLNSILVNMTAPTGKAAEALDKLGYSAFDSKGKFLGLEKSLLLMKEKLKGANDEQMQYFTSAIGGKTQLTELQQILDGVGNEYGGLKDKILNSRGALKQMADTINNTMTGALARFNSATDDMKINFVKQIEPEITPVINKIAESLPALTQNLAKGTKNLVAFFKKGEPFFSFVLKNGMTIASSLVAVGVSLKTFLIVKKITAPMGGLLDTFKAFKVLLLGNPYALIIGAIAGALAFLTIKMIAFNAKMKKENLASHFGNISLSMEELDDVARRIVRTKNLDKVEESLSAFAEVENIKQSLADTTRSLDKLNWKVSIGFKLDESEKEAYLDNISSFIKDSQDALLQQQFALNISLDVFTDDDEMGNKIKAGLNSFYQENYNEIAKLGTELNKVTTEAWNDGLLEIDEAEKIQRISDQMSRITNELTKGKFEASMQMIAMKFSGKDLDGETFKQLQESLNAQANTATVNYDNSFQHIMGNLNTMLDNKKILPDDYAEQSRALKLSYLDQTSGIQSKAAEFQMNTILGAYSEAFDKLAPEYSTRFNNAMTKMLSAADANGEISGFIFQDFLQEINSIKIDGATRRNLQDLYDAMKPTIEQISQTKASYEELGAEIPSSISKGLMDASLLGALLKDQDSIFTLMNSSFNQSSPQFQEMARTWKENGAVLPNNFYTETLLQYPAMENSGIGLASALLNSFEKELSKGTHVTIPLTASLSTSIGPIDPGGQFGIKGHAKGSNYTDSTFIAGEAGAELITDRKGSKVFTALETGNIFSNLNQIPVVLYNKVKGALAQSLKFPNLYSPTQTEEVKNPFQLSNTSSNSNLEINYSPNITITIQGDADKNKTQDAVMTAIREGYNEIRAIVRDEMDRIKSRNERLSNA